MAKRIEDFFQGLFLAPFVIFIAVIVLTVAFLQLFLGLAFDAVQAVCRGDYRQDKQDSR